MNLIVRKNDERSYEITWIPSTGLGKIKKQLKEVKCSSNKRSDCKLNFTGQQWFKTVRRLKDQK